VGVADEVAGGAGLLEQAAKQREVAASRLDRDRRRRLKPPLGDRGRLGGGERVGEDGGMCAQPQEGEDDRPREGDRLLSDERLPSQSRAASCSAARRLTA
jgi:hypothetical protein